MNFLGKDTQITPTGQAIKINTLAASALSNLFSTNIGPDGCLKMLITPSNTISLTKDGTTICNEVNFSHPLSRLISSSANSLSKVLGDGISTFVCLCCEILTNSVSYHNDGTPIHKICNGIQNCLKDIISFFDSNKIEIDDINRDDVIKKLLYTFLNTKIDDEVSLKFSDFIFKGLRNISEGVPVFDTNMIELMQMGDGDPEDSLFVNGLVLDHGNRHPLMPTIIDECAIMITNMSLEYEKPEVNAQFNYKSADERDAMAVSEREFIFKRANEVANFAKEVKEKTGKNLVVISERGIDPVSLEVLASNNILALRRAKRRNIERLIKMCGGNLISREDNLKFENLGYCQRVKVLNFGDDKFTFVEGTPFKGSCTILIKGNTKYEVERIVSAVKGAIKCVSHAMRDKVYLKGGIYLISNLCSFIEKKIKEVQTNDVVGYKVMRKSFLNIAKNLIRNEGTDVEEKIIKIERGDVEDEGVIDNYCVLTKVTANACILGINLLMVDDIIKAGKPLKEEKDEPK